MKPYLKLLRFLSLILFLAALAFGISKYNKQSVLPIDISTPSYQDVPEMKGRLLYKTALKSRMPKVYLGV